MTYDALDRVIGVTNAAGDVNTMAYDPVGNIIQTVDPAGTSPPLSTMPTTV